MYNFQLNIDQIEEIELDLTGYCNLACPLCTRNYAHAVHLLKKNIRSLKEIVDQLSKFINLKRFFIAGAVSEPTLYPEFIQFIEYLNSRSITFELFTNGNTHNQQWWQKLGEIVLDNSLVAFTICGSTQELHEKYRKNSNLQQILSNAQAYRKNDRHNDWAQLIRFEYNKDDINSQNMRSIISQFSHVMIVDSEGIRRLDSKIASYEHDIMPIKKRDSAIKYIFNQRSQQQHSPICCKSYNEKKVYIDQFGKIYPCYIAAEFMPDMNFVSGSTLVYDGVFNHRYIDCYACTEYVNNMIDKLKLDFIC